MDLRPTMWKCYKISWPNLIQGFPWTFWVPLSKEENYVSSIFYFIEWTAGGGWNCNMKFWIVKREYINESGPVGIEVVRIFSPNPVYSCLVPQVVHLWKGTITVWSNTPSVRHGAMVSRIVNWKGPNAYSVTSPLNIWTIFGVWLPRTLGGPPSKG